VSPSSGRLLVLMHVACEPAAEYARVLTERGLGFDELLLTDDVALPDWRDYAGIIAMGGPMGAYDDDLVPWLAAEKRLINEAVTSGVPYWGVCLGAQLLAAALGADVYPGPAPEVGISRVSITPEAAQDPVFAGVAATFPAFQWHGDTFELPAGATLLAGNDAYRHQAFAVGGAYGLQFHVEVDAALAAEWLEVPAYRESLAAVRGAGAEAEVLSELTAEVDTTIRLARQLFAAWLDAWVMPRVERG